MCRAGGNYVPRMRFVWCVCRSRFVLMGHRTTYQLMAAGSTRCITRVRGLGLWLVQAMDTS